jgi:uncharacterized protein (DUF305 family)
MKTFIKGITTVGFALALAAPLFSADSTEMLRDLKGQEFDRAFTSHMTQHHQQGIAMAQLAIQRAQNERVKEFATKTASSQQKELQQMKSHSGTSANTESSAGAGASGGSHSGSAHATGAGGSGHSAGAGHNAGGAGHGGMHHDSMNSMSKLEAAEGAAFDRLFVEEMTKHHSMAMEMAQLAKQRAASAELKTMADQMVQSQKKEIDELRALRKGFSG